MQTNFSETIDKISDAYETAKDSINTLFYLVYSKAEKEKALEDAHIAITQLRDLACTSTQAAYAPPPPGQPKEVVQTKNATTAQIATAFIVGLLLGIGITLLFS